MINTSSETEADVSSIELGESNIVDKLRMLKSSVQKFVKSCPPVSLLMHNLNAKIKDKYILHGLLIIFL